MSADAVKGFCPDPVASQTPDEWARLNSKAQSAIFDVYEPALQTHIPLAVINIGMPMRCTGDRAAARMPVWCSH